MNVNVKNQSGLNGGECASSGTLTGDFNAIQCITNATITSVKGNVSGLNGTSLTAGTIIYGRYSEIVIGSGTIIAYNYGG